MRDPSAVVPPPRVEVSLRPRWRVQRLGSLTPHTTAIVVGLLTALLLWQTGWHRYRSPASGPYRVEKVSGIVRDGRLDVSASVIGQSAEQLLGWFVLAKPGEPDPATNFAYRSSEIERRVMPNEAQEFRWSEPLDVPNGTYHLSLWFHHRVDERWVHAVAGTFGLAPVAVRRDPGAPFQQFYGGAVAAVNDVRVVAAEGVLRFDVEVAAADGIDDVTFAWELRPAYRSDAPAAYTGATRLLAFDRTHRTKLVAVEELVAVAKGTYDLWLTVEGNRPEDQRQLVVYRQALRQTAALPYIRRASPAGPFSLSIPSPLQALEAGRIGNLDLVITGASSRAQCRVMWQLMTPSGRPVGSGEAGPCNEAHLVLPQTLVPGDYGLELTALAVKDQSSLESDRIVVPAVIA